jgi:hypothetical protein
VEEEGGGVFGHGKAGLGCLGWYSILYGVYVLNVLIALLLVYVHTKTYSFRLDP